MSETYVFPLTRLTRGAGASRRVIIQGFDIPMRGLIIFMAGLAPSGILMLFLWPFFGVYALASIIVVETAIFTLFEGRSRQGMKLRNYQAIWDRKKAAVDKFFCCGEEFQPGQGVQRMLKANTVPVEKRDRADALEQLVDWNFAGAAQLGARAADTRDARRALRRNALKKHDEWTAPVARAPRVKRNAQVEQFTPSPALLPPAMAYIPEPAPEPVRTAPTRPAPAFEDGWG